MDVGDAVLWLYAAASFVPLFLNRRGKNSSRQLAVVRTEVGLAVTAPFVGMLQDGLWVLLYVVIAGLWAFNAWVSTMKLRAIEEEEARRATPLSAFSKEQTEDSVK